MKRDHVYTLQLNWTGDSKENHVVNDRVYEIEIEGKPILKGSADTPFFGDGSKYNPEDLLLSSLSACHMMSFFYVCRKQGITITSYKDKPQGFLKVNIDGSGQFEKVILRPEVVIEDNKQRDMAEDLHNQAGKLCFIANSVNFEILYEPRFRVTV